MATFGGVQIDDNLLPGAPTASAAAPSLGAIFSGAAQQAYGQVRYGLPYAIAKADGSLTQDDDAFYRKGLADTSAAARVAAPSTLGDVFAGKTGIGRFIAEQGAALIPSVAAPVVGGLLGSAIGPEGTIAGVAGTIAAGTPQFVGSGVQSALDRDGGLSSESATRALALAPVESAINAYAERFLPGAGHFLGDAAASQTGNFVSRVAQSALKGGSAQAVAAATTTLGDRYTAGQDVTGPDAAAEYVSAAGTGFVLGGVLSAAGGFRRDPAHVKNPSDVTTQDTDQATDAVLNGTPALPAPDTRLALPAPDPSQPTVQQRADLVSDPRGNTAPNTPAGIAGLAATPISDVAVDSRGNAFVNPTAADLATVPNAPVAGTPAAPGPSGLDLANASFANADNVRQIGDTVRDILAGNRPSTVPEALRAPSTFDPAAAVARLEASSATSARAIDADGAFNGTANTATLPDVRVFKDEPIADLHRAIADKSSTDEVKGEAAREIATRTAEAVGEAPLTAEKFQARVDDLKQGLRGSFVTKLEATSPADLLNKVYDQVLVNQDTASSVTKLAQRVGLLDAKLEPTALANRIETERATPDAAPEAPQGTPVTSADAATPSAAVAAGTDPVQAPADSTESAPAEASAPAAPAAPVSIAPRVVDPEYAAQFEELKKAAGIDTRRTSAGLKAAGLDVAPANAEDARAKVFSALADDKTNAATSQVEKLAQKLGLISNDDARDVTELGHRTYLDTPAAAPEIEAARLQQGLEGTQGDAFKQGVSAVATGRDVAGHTSVEDMAAYQEGKVWAEDQVKNSATKTTAQSEAIRSRLAARETAREGGPREERLSAKDVTDRQLEPGEVRHDALNRLIDSADLTNVPDDQVAGLRRMVSDGSTATELGRALQDVQGGTVRFAQPRVETPVTRGQPVFKEMNERATAAQSRATARAEIAAGKRVYDLRQAIRQAVVDKEITVSRADRLNDMLDAGKTDQVDNLTKDFGSITREAAGGREELGPPDLALEQALTGKTFEEGAQYLADHAPSQASGAIMRAVVGLAAKIKSVGGHDFALRIIRPNDRGGLPQELYARNNRGAARVEKNPARATVFLKSSELGSGGTNFQIAAHEMIHAVTLQALDFGRKADANTVLGRASRDMDKLLASVEQHFRQRAAEGDLSDFERAIRDGRNNAIDNTDELLAWGLTNPEMQQYLQTIQYAPRQSVFAKFVGLVRGMLGLEPKTDTALSQLLRVSEQVFGASENELRPAFARDGVGPLDAPITAALNSDAANSDATRTVGVSNEMAGHVMGTLAGAAERVPWATMGGLARRAALALPSLRHIAEVTKESVPPVMAIFESKQQHDAVRGRFASLGDAVYQKYEQVQRASKPLSEKVVRLMAAVAEHRLDPEKAFDLHGHLDADAANFGQLKALHTTLGGWINDLRRGDGAAYQMYRDAVTHNETLNYARMAAELHSLVALDPEYKAGVNGAKTDPTQVFMTTSGLSSPESVRDHWKAALDLQLKQVSDFVREKKGEAASGTPGEIRGMNQHLSPIEAKIASTNEALVGMARAPYFHLGRFGDQFASATIKKLESGLPDPRAKAAVIAAIDKAGFNNIQISTENTNPKFVGRFQGESQLNSFTKVLRELHAQGHLEGELSDITAGPREMDSNLGVSSSLPLDVQGILKSLDNDPRYVPDPDMSAADRGNLARQKELAMTAIRDAWIEQQPDSAISKVLTARADIPGFDPDMMRNFAHRASVGASHMANVGTGVQASDAMLALRSLRTESRQLDSKLDRNLINDVYGEMVKRNAQAPRSEISNVVEKALAVSHPYYLGLSPAYAMIQLMQVGTNAIPELAKQHGFGASFHAIRRASTDAFAVMKAASILAAKGGLAHAADVSLTEQALQNSGLSKGKIDFLRQMIAGGSLDVGQSANALNQIARHGTSSKLEVATKYASAMGLHAETFSRLATALAAADLHASDDPQVQAKYAKNVVSESMFDYQSWNKGRAFGKQGFLGPVTPLLTQFMTYSTQMTEKLYREAHSAIGIAREGETAEQTAQRASEARTYLAGHLTAITAMAGTLGLPFAGAFAAALDKGVNTFGTSEQPFDATASWRNFLASVLGKDVAEVVSRGAPRALGFDLSTRIGEADLLPFTQALGDRRGWREAYQAAAGRATGAAPDMLLNFADAGQSFARGDVLGGMKAALPVAFKGPIEAYRMDTQGYVDSRGEKMAVSPGAGAILYQLLGFTPAEKAEYNEARGDLQSRQIGLKLEARKYQTQLVRAASTGDQAGLTALIAKVASFDQANPTYAVLPGIGDAVSRHATSQATARALGTPVGVNVRDVAARQMVGYANFSSR